MMVRLIGAVERLPAWSSRGLMVVRPVLLLGVLLAGFLLARTGARSGSHRVVASGRLLPPTASSSTTAHTTASASSRPVAAASPGTHGPAAARGVRDPDARPLTSGYQVAMLAVALRFAVAYMP
jgi:hypothetical protein